MPAGYAPLANPRSAPDAEREMEDAFESDNDDNGIDDHENTPLTAATTTQRDHFNNIPGAYDFEREYDYPPPGSPPRPSSTALPNDYGNSNGLLPTSPIVVPKKGPSFFRKAVGALLPSHYTRVPAEASSSRALGGGIENDGVFANVMAKPQPAQVITTEDGDIRLVPEESQKEVPPSYVEAQADAVPPYWETTIHAPAGLEHGGDLIIDDLPTGPFWVFLLNAFISFFFQFVGFLLTYLLATSHAGRYGARAGLGLTLIQFGIYSREAVLAAGDAAGDSADASSGSGWMSGSSTTSPSTRADATPTDDTAGNGMLVTSGDWLSFLFMTLGWFLLLSSIIGYWKVKRWEHSVRAPQRAPSAPVGDPERELQIRRNIENVFGISFDEDHAVDHHRRRAMEAQVADDTRLTRDLRAAGLI